jgi:hypothetical protein
MFFRSSTNSSGLKKPRNDSPIWATLSLMASNAIFSPSDELLKAIREFRKFNDELTLRGVDYAQAVQSLNKAIDRADIALK